MALYTSLRRFFSNTIKPCHQLSRLLHPANNRTLVTPFAFASWNKERETETRHASKHNYMTCRFLSSSSSSSSTSCQSGNTVSSTQGLPEIDFTDRLLEINWYDGTKSRYHSIWLRNNCQCNSCVQPHSGQKTMNQADIPIPCLIESTEVIDGTHLRITWQHCEHAGRIPLDFLYQNSYGKEALEASAKLRNYSFFKGPIQEFDFTAISSSNTSYFSWLKCLDIYGIALVTNVPCEENQVAKVAELIAPVQHTLYGEVFDVKAKENPINIAYSTAGIGFHMDLVYYESAPGIQLLHCVRFDESSEGGENMFVDVFHVVSELRSLYPQHFDTLTRVPATFQKIHFEREHPAAYMYQRPHISVNPQGVVTAVHWSPPFEGPLNVNEDDVEPYYEAYKIFTELLDNSPVQVEQRMKNGDCVVFNNKRILHARNSFKLNGGQRHLQGCYVNIDDFRNGVQVAYIQQGTEELSKRCSNQCWF